MDYFLSWPTYPGVMWPNMAGAIFVLNLEFPDFCALILGFQRWDVCQIEGLFTLIILVPAVLRSVVSELRNLSSNHRKIDRSIFLKINSRVSSCVIANKFLQLSGNYFHFCSRFWAFSWLVSDFSWHALSYTHNLFLGCSFAFTAKSMPGVRAFLLYLFSICVTGILMSAEWTVLLPFQCYLSSFTPTYSNWPSVAYSESTIQIYKSSSVYIHLWHRTQERGVFKFGLSGKKVSLGKNKGWMRQNRMWSVLCAEPVQVLGETVGTSAASGGCQSRFLSEAQQRLYTRTTSSENLHQSSQRKSRQIRVKWR